LIQACGPIFNDSELLHALRWDPKPLPDTIDFLNNSSLAAHASQLVRSMHVPTQEGLHIANAIDVMLRQGYVPRNPNTPSGRASMYQRGMFGPPDLAAQSILVTGISGVGKTRAVDRTLQRYKQVVEHSAGTFPGLVSGLRQLVWLKIDVPANGSARSLAQALMVATDKALGTTLFDEFFLSKKRFTPTELLDIWWRVAKTHFLGMLILDEVSHFFKIETLKDQLKNKAGTHRPMLRVADDEALKFIVNLNNTAKLPTVFICTPDGIEALTSRLSSAERLVTNGFYELMRDEDTEGSVFRKRVFPELVKHISGKHNHADDEKLRRRLYELSAGVPRIYINLWVLANRVMVQRKGSHLTIADLERVMHKHMAPLKPAIDALLSNDPGKLTRYEDLYPKSPEFWSLIEHLRL
jgi:hypothetical protein